MCCPGRQRPEVGDRVGESLAPLRIDGVVDYPAEYVDRYREEGYWIGQTHWDLLVSSGIRHADKVAVTDGSRTLTYAQLELGARSLAQGLRTQGINRGDRVVVHFPNVPEFLEMMFALYALGAVPVFALPAHRRSEIEYFVEFAGAVAYVTVDAAGGFRYGDLADDLAASIAGLKSFVLKTSGTEPDDSILRRSEPLADERNSLPSDVAFLQLSGGTTGRPKLIPRTHDDYLYSVRASCEICEVTADTVFLVVLPVSHNFTMSSPGVLGALHAGATIVMAPDPSPDTVFPLIEKYRVTMVSAVPPIVLTWMNSSSRNDRDLSSLATIQVGGAKFSESAARRIPDELGATLQQVFGMAEGLVNYTRLHDDSCIIESTQGRPISPADEVRVVDDNDDDVPLGDPGHLLTRGPYTIRGYFNAPEHNRTSFTGAGFYRTGDIVRQDVHGNLTVVGRAKDQINRGGEKVAPEEIENHLLAHPAVHDVSVVGVPDDHLGERSKALIILRADHRDSPPSAIEMRRFLRQRNLAAYKVPDLVGFVDEFPRTSVGKISKNSQR